MRIITVTESQMQDYEAYFGLDRDVLIPHLASLYGYYLVVVEDEAEVTFE